VSGPDAVGAASAESPPDSASDARSDTPSTPLPAPPREPGDVPSKTLATWIAVIAGSFGLHHFYLGGRRRWLGLLYPIPTLVGISGALRMEKLGIDDRLSWILIPWLGLTISAGMMCAIVIGLTSDAKWARLYAGDPTLPVVRATRDEDDESPPPGIVHTAWGPVLGVILALMIGGAVLMGTIAFSIEKAFDVQRDDGAAAQR
jgi:hypothetical protein